MSILPKVIQFTKCHIQESIPLCNFILLLVRFKCKIAKEYHSFMLYANQIGVLSKYNYLMDSPLNMFIKIPPK